MQRASSLQPHTNNNNPNVQYQTNPSLSKYTSIPRTQYNAFNRYHRSNSNVDSHSNPPISKINITVRNNHHNRTKTQPIIHKPLPPTPPNAKKQNNYINTVPHSNTQLSKMNIMPENNQHHNRTKTQPFIKREDNNNKKTQLQNGCNHIRSDTVPIMYKPLPPTPPNAKKRSIPKFIPSSSVPSISVQTIPSDNNSYDSISTKTMSPTKIKKIRCKTAHHIRFSDTAQIISKHNACSSSISTASSTELNIKKYRMRSQSSPDRINGVDDSKDKEEDLLQIMDTYKPYEIESNENNEPICFDKCCIQKDRYNYCLNKQILLSSKGLDCGYYEWSIEIIKCEGSLQEMGVVSNPNVDSIKINDNGIINTPAFGARAVYGNDMDSTVSVYYASYNTDNKQRCFKDLSKKNKSQNCWGKGDVIKICLNLKKYHIAFFLNDKKVRKKISVQPNKTYYPFISFVGNFEYDTKCHTLQ